MLFIINIAHIFVALLVLYGWKLDSHNKIVFTPFIVFIVLELVFSLNYWLIFQDIDIQVSNTALIASMVSISFFTFGYIAWGTYKQVVFDAPYPASQTEHFIEQPVEESRSQSPYAFALLLLLIIGSVIGALYFRGYPPTVLGMEQWIAQGDLSEAQSLVSSGRRALTKSHVFGEAYRGQGVLKNLLFVVWTYGLLLSALIALRNRKIWWKGLFLLFFIGSVLFIGGTGERSRVLWSLVVVLIGFSFVRNLNARKMFVALVFFFVCLVGLSLLTPRYQLAHDKWHLMGNLVQSVFQRLASGDKINNLRMIHHLENGALERGYGGEHLRVALNALPGIHRPPLAHHLAESMQGETTTTYASGTYLGLVYVDFGLAGIVLIYLMMGMFVRECSQRMMGWRKSPENLVFMAFLSYALGNMSARAGVVSLLPNLLPIFMIHLMVLMVLSYFYRTRLVRPSNRGEAIQGA